ncbi:MAG: TIR domain-containing protein [Dehalococcoidia bacterium]
MTSETLLQSMIGEVEEYWTESDNNFSSPEHQSHTSSKRVFVVHGHNEAIRNSVARFLERIDLDPIILNEKPNKGGTVIEKFFDYADVGFAVVLLTADDVGRAKDDDALLPRARQNVILELGFFLGRLSSGRVAALYENDVKIPSDYKGVIYTPLDDAGAWQLSLARELHAAGLEVDLNKIM